MASTHFNRLTNGVFTTESAVSFSLLPRSSAKCKIKIEGKKALEFEFQCFYFLLSCWRRFVSYKPTFFATVVTILSSLLQLTLSVFFQCMPSTHIFLISSVKSLATWYWPQITITSETLFNLLMFYSICYLGELLICFLFRNFLTCSSLPRNMLMERLNWSVCLKSPPSLILLRSATWFNFSKWVSNTCYQKFCLVSSQNDKYLRPKYMVV